MCKYCESKSNLADAGIKDILNNGIYIVYLCGGNEKQPEDGRFDFCPMCGTPLGEVKPLTVEQLRVMSGKPVWIKDLGGYCIKTHWVIFWVSDFDCDIEKYGITWLAFDREPKGEAE